MTAGGRTSGSFKFTGETRRPSGEFRAEELVADAESTVRPIHSGRRRSGPYTRIQTPQWSQATGAANRFDLRATRDLSGRRLGREWTRNVARTILLIVGDAVACAVAYYATIALVGLSAEKAAYLVPRLAIFVIFGQAAVRTYSGGRAHGEYGKVLLGTFLASGGRLFVETLYDVSGFAFSEHVLLAVALGVTMCVWRFSVARFARGLYAMGVGQKRTLTVADLEHAVEVRERFLAADEPRVKHVGHITPGSRQGDANALGTIDDLARLIEQLDISYVLVASALPKDQFERVVHTCFMHGAAVSVVPGTLTQLPCRVTSKDLLGWPLLELQAPRVHLVQIVVKRTMDVVTSLLLIVLLSPLFALIALAIRLESKGSTIFRQSRPGLGGKRFWMLKFRTMHPDAEAILEADPVLLKRFLQNDCKLPANEDPRISKVGAILRKTSLDELPQLFNVLAGDMSLIGPRPVVGPELDSYGEWASTVLGVRPGMTGYWQVAGRSQVVFPERAHMDIYYVTRWSLALDLKILVLTIPAVLRRSGAH